jgi:ABC-type antimicrobial peptide transport system permease subunit
MILKNLFRRKIRSILTLLGIAMGIAAIVALGAIAAGFASGMTSLVSGSGADLSVMQKDASDLLLSAVDEEVGRQIALMPQVKAVSGAIFTAVSLEGIPYFMIFGYDPKEFAIAHYKIARGRQLMASREIILGNGAARNLKKDVGDTLQFLGNTFRIVGIYETGAAFEEAGGVITLTDAQVILQKPRQVMAYQIKLRNVRDEALVKQRIEMRFKDVTVARGAQFVQQEQGYQMMQALAVGIAMIAVLVGGLGMMNTVMMSVFERTREIGVLRALGWGRRRVLTMILGESLLLASVGGVIGALLGIGLVKLMGTMPALNSLVIGQFSLDLFVMAGATALALGAVGGLYPAWRAARLQPVEALRYEGGAAEAVRRVPVGGMLVQNLARRRSRTLLTTGGIAIGVAVIVALGALTEGWIQQFTAILTGSGADLTAMQAKVADLSLSAVDETTLRRIATMPQVAEATGAAIGFATAPEMPYVIVLGIEPGSSAMRRYRPTEGHGIQGRSDILIGRLTADNMKKHVGDTFRLLNGMYRVVGIYETGVGYEDGAVVMDLREAQNLFQKPRQVMLVQIKLKDPRDAVTVQREIERRFPEVAVSCSADFIENTQDLQVTKTLMGALSSIAIIIGGVGVMNTVLMSIFERTREIGVLRALGWRRRRILQSVIGESLLLSAVGGAVGALLGTGLTLGIAQIPAIANLVQGYYSSGLYVQAMLVALMLGAIGGLYPAWRASQLSPAEALRYE